MASMFANMSYSSSVRMTTPFLHLSPHLSFPLSFYSHSFKCLASINFFKIPQHNALIAPAIFNSHTPFPLARRASSISLT